MTRPEDDDRPPVEPVVAGDPEDPTGELEDRKHELEDRKHETEPPMHEAEPPRHEAEDPTHVDEVPAVLHEDPAPDERAAVVRRERLESILESLLFAADRPLTAVDLAALVEEPKVQAVEETLAAMQAAWSERGVQLHAVAGGWQFRTHPSNASWVQRLLAQKPVRLTRSQLETLAIIAYRQPVTRPEIDDIRGVDSGGTLKTLLDRQLVRILGKREEPGRPLLYGTTKEFLEFFNLRDLKELPTLREFHELTDEHRAQVEALEQAAPPGAIEPKGMASSILAPENNDPPPLSRVDLSDAPLEEDLGAIDELIESAEVRSRAVAQALGDDAGREQAARAPEAAAETPNDDGEPDPPPPES